MNTPIRFAALSILAAAASVASASSVPLVTGDALRDEMIVAQAANHKAMAQPMKLQMVQTTATTTPVLQYQATGDALTDEKLFTQQAQARRHMTAGKGSMAALKDSTNRQ